MNHFYNLMMIVRVGGGDCGDCGDGGGNCGDCGGDDGLMW